jgi:hypothetical protein
MVSWHIRDRKRLQHHSARTGRSRRMRETTVDRFRKLGRVKMTAMDVAGDGEPQQLEGRGTMNEFYESVDVVALKI